jgi:ribosomal protein S18 acetylase RimI-like enzyme
VDSGSEPELQPGSDADALGDPEPLQPEHIERAARTFAQAFAWHEPFYEWLMPEESTREERIFELVEADLRDRFLDEGWCWTIGGGAAITMWIPPLSRTGKEKLAARRSDGDYAKYGEFADGLRAGDQLIRNLKPPQPHWFLDTIAVAPEYHRQGLGAKLLDHNLAIRDEAGDVCALDTHTDDNIGFYGRRGFEVAGHGPLAEGLEVYVMVREPRG